eukprot:Phypoly_transcript_18718.p1 GENE.Phypoly_transcript_18718~~Phypoly_transcript_18718.p1  ORF type:complete len:223 (+),score=18.90 Phypoly_transcript_18718:48-716(+)
MKQYLVILSLFLLSHIFLVSSNEKCFVFSVDPSPLVLSSHTPVTLDMLKSSHGEAFIKQYNSHGIGFLAPTLFVTRCEISFGQSQCISAGENDFLYNFAVSGKQHPHCNMASLFDKYVKLGTSSSKKFYNSLSASDFDDWEITTCPSAGRSTRYTLLYDNSCSTSVSSRIPPKGTLCCHYFSDAENQIISTCQPVGNSCPVVGGHTSIYNTSAPTCEECKRI